MRKHLLQPLAESLCQIFLLYFLVLSHSLSAELKHFFFLFMIDTAPNFIGAQNSDRELKRREFQICNFRHE